jgi:methionyl-tRNA formyltransferase
VRLIFAGTPEFARVALERLHAAGHEIVLVLSQPDRPAGRGMKLQASAVKQFALEIGAPVAQPRSLRLDGKYPDDAAAAQAAIAAAQADAMVVAAYGLILPPWALAAPPLGCFNIHASLLPRWRGAAPIHRAIEAGDAETGVTIMQMDAGLDTGDMLLVGPLPIDAQDTTATLHDKVAELGGQLMVEALQQAASGSLNAVPQPLEGISYAHKIEKHEAAIDWAQPAPLITQRVRAFNPFPGATATLKGEVLKVWGAHVAPELPPVDVVFGSIVAVAPEGIAVAAMNSIVILTELQRPGGKRLQVADFLRGFELTPGMVFEKRADLCSS